MESIVKLLKNKYAPFFFAVPIFMLLYRYSGIVMDAILYLTQYVYSVDPSRFEGDPAFAFGNQDSLGFFSPILGLFIKPLGANKGMLVFTALMQLCWVISAVFMIKSLMRLMQNRLWILPISILFVLIFANAMPIGRIKFFHFVECYACSRSLSIALGIGSLAALFSNKRWLSLALILLGTAVHPLTAGWCLPLWCFYFFPKTRWFIVIGSLLFPFTFLLHTGRFDFYPSDWMIRPLEYTPSYATIGKFVMLLVFFGFVVRCFTRNKQIRELAFAMTLVLGIAMYWDFWGGFGEHVLLYQSQPWRVFWLGAIVAVPLFLCFLKDALMRLRKKKNWTTREFALILTILNLISPQCLISVTVAIVILLKMKVKEKAIQRKQIVFVFLAFVFIGLIAQQYNIWCLQGFKPIFGYSFYAVCHIRDAALYGQFCFCVAFIIYYVRKRQFVIPIILALYCFIPQYQLIPLLALFLMSYPRTSKAKCLIYAIMISAVIIVDGIFNSEVRLHRLVGGFPSNTLLVILIGALSMMVIWLRKYTRVPMIVLLLTCSAFAIGTYDGRKLDTKVAEDCIDHYLTQTVFPQIKDRGRILFYVEGHHKLEPRLRFLTGSYLSLSAHVGTLFNEKHYKEIRKRYEKISGEKVSEKTFRGVTYIGIVSTLLSNSDSLVAKTKQLCEQGEIHYLVSSFMELDLPIEDSTTIENGRKINLYACP